MNGRDDPRSVLKRAMGLEDDDKLHYGVRSQDVLSLFHYVVAQHAAEGRTVEFQWVRIGRNHSIKGQGWSGKDCLSTFMNPGCYVILGKTKMNNSQHIALMKCLNKMTSEVDRLAKYARYATGAKRINHAISVIVDEYKNGILIDNGCVNKTYSILNLASRMEDVSYCYKMHLSIKL